MLVQLQRGGADTEQMRGMVKDELVNREILMQEAQKAGVEVKARIEPIESACPVDGDLAVVAALHHSGAAAGESLA